MDTKHFNNVETISIYIVNLILTQKKEKYVIEKRIDHVENYVACEYTQMFFENNLFLAVDYPMNGVKVKRVCGDIVTARAFAEEPDKETLAAVYKELAEALGCLVEAEKFQNINDYYKRKNILKTLFERS